MSEFEHERPRQLGQSGRPDQSGRAEDNVYNTPDVYQSQTEEDIYQTPDIQVESYDTGGVFSGEQATAGGYGNGQYGNSAYGNQSYGNEQYGSTVYGSQSYGNDSYGTGPYGNQPCGNDPYGNQVYGNASARSGQYENNSCGTNQYEDPSYGKNQYGIRPYGNGQYGNQPYGNGQYGNQPYGNGQYRNSQYGNQQYGNQPYGNGQYGNQQYGNGQYGNQQYGNSQYGNQQYGRNPYGSPYSAGQYPYTPYSPYAVPPKKKHTGLIIGMIIGIVFLFLVAVLTLLYYAVESLSKRRDAEYLEEFYKDYFDEDDHRDDYRHGQSDDGQDDSFHSGGAVAGEDDGAKDKDEDISGYESDGSGGHDYDADEYYTLHDDIKDLSYSIEWEEYEYDTNEENVSIMVEYPVVVGSHIPNLDKINDIIAGEVSVFTDYYEEEYSGYMYDDSSYFNAYSAGYVTFMSEDILSVVFSEYVYTDYFDSIYLYSINVDMQNGVILDNTDIIMVDDDFSVDFRYRSDEQNGAVEGLEWMTDQDITELLSSEGNLIIFYTPQGMEIGFNYDEGWVTVTYHDYKDFLKIF